MEMEITAAEDIGEATDLFPPLCPLAYSLYDSFLSSHCSCCFSLLPPAPPQTLYCSGTCSLTDSAIVFPPIPPDISPVLSSDIRAALRLLYSISSSFSAVLTQSLPHRFGGLLTNHHRLMADSSISHSIRSAAEFLRSQGNSSVSDRKDTKLEEAAICSVLTNAVEVQDSTGRPLGIAVYEPRFSWINHSCSPNTCYRFVISPPRSNTTPYQDDLNLISPKTVPHITNNTEKEEEVSVCSITSLWEGCGKTVRYGPKIIARSIKRIKIGEEITVSYIDLLQPTELRQSDLWSKYRFMCSCVRCVASPPTYVDSILEASSINCDLVLDGKDEAVGKMSGYIEEAIDDFLSDEINPETCCEKIEHVLLHGWLHPIHHVALNAYITLSTAYRIRSIDSDLKKAFEMRRISASYSFFLACVSHHLLSTEPSLAISAANFWKSTGESLLDLSRKFSMESSDDVKCTKCHILETPNSRQLMRCVTDISQVAWSFLTRGCTYLQKFKSPFEFSLTDTKGDREEEESSEEDQRVNQGLKIWEVVGYKMERRIIFFWLILVFDLVLRVTGNEEGNALMVFRKSLTDPDQVFETWDDTLVSPCTWSHVTCVNDRVTRLDLGNSNLSGQLVTELGELSNLKYLELYSNNITGPIPEELGNLKELESLDLYSNNLTGLIPSTLGRLKKLRFLRLNNNSLSGEIPRSLTGVLTLQVLDLSNNPLTGDIPVDGSFARFTPISFDHTNLTTLLPSSPLSPPISPSENNRIIGAIFGGVAAAVLLLFGVPAIAFALTWWRRRQQDHFFDVPDEESPEVHLGQHLKRFSLRELQIASDNFNNRNVLGRGGFGKVYKARLADGSLVAVKRLKEEHTQGGELQFQTEVEIISLAVHRNLIRLRGFCMTPTERLLVYPYMANGSLASCLKEHPPLSWSKRRHIALGSARGLAYLHDHCDPKIIHRDVKAANILLDEEFEAVVGDFGLAKLMNYKDTHVTTAVRGTIGHIAPEYLSMGQSSEKTDVFGYGVMLLELITGKRAFDLARLANNHDAMLLLEWVEGLLRDKKLEELVDVDLRGNNYVEEEVEELIKVALLCNQSSPMGRPKMSEVVRMLEGDGLGERWEKWQKEEMFRQDFNYQDHHNASTSWIIGDSISHAENEYPSGPR